MNQNENENRPVYASLSPSKNALYSLISATSINYTISSFQMLVLLIVHVLRCHASLYCYARRSLNIKHDIDL